MFLALHLCAFSLQDISFHRMDAPADGAGVPFIQTHCHHYGILVFVMGMWIPTFVNEYQHIPNLQDRNARD